jgi:transposase
MAEPLVSDALWERIEPLLPKHHSPTAKGGRPPVDDRAALEGILFVLKTGIQWEDLPYQFGCCGMTCWRRLRDWQAAEVWDKLHAILLSDLREADRLDWSRAVIDSSSVRAVGGGEKTGPNPTDRRRPGSKHHVLTDGGGVPLQIELSAANTPDIKHLASLITHIPQVRGKPGRPRSRPDRLHGDRAYHSKFADALLSWLGIEPQIAKRGTAHGSGLGKFRWVVERTISWLHQYRRLRVRYERRDDIHEGFLACAKSLICLRVLTAAFC